MLTFHVSVALVGDVRLAAPGFLKNWPIRSVTKRVYIDHMIYSMVVHRLLSTIIVCIELGLITIKPMYAAQSPTLL